MRGPLERRVFIIASLLAACCLFLCHCAARQSGITVLETARKDDEAAQLLQNILDMNARVNTIKGIGFVTIEQDNLQNRFRVAWIGCRPNKIRLEILAPTGQPVMSFASDGKRQYLLSYSDNRLYRRKTSENGLKRLVAMAIKPEDILDLLSGRLPVSSESRAAIGHYSGSGAPVLMLETPGRGDRERIYSKTEEGETFHRMERYDRRGRLKFRAVFEKMRDIEGTEIPELLTVRNDIGAMIRIETERCWINPVIPKDRFVLMPPN